jgi:diguanylate cyclase (GGDEF)-like protein
MPPVGLNIEDLPDSPYTQALRTGVRHLRFERELERSFVADHLQRVRLRAQVWSSVSAALSLLFVSLQGSQSGIASAAFWEHMGVPPVTIALAWLSWSRLYERWYLKVATLLGPIFGVLVALLIAQAVAGGHEYSVALLTVHVIAALFFMGLLFRAGLVTALAMLGTFAFSTFALGWRGAAWPDVMVVALTALLGAIVGRDVETSFRRTYLESALLSQWVTSDGLSGLMNRRALDAELPRVWQQAERDRRTIALMMIDVDHFKAFNDRFGHQFGDEAIRAVARLLSDAARRPLDLAARYGGEEFLLLLYDVSIAHAADLADRLRRSVEATTLLPERAADAAVTVSIGVAVVSPTVGRTVDGALQLADEALYEAKQAGRNRLVVKGADDYRVLRTGLFSKSLN